MGKYSYEIYLVQMLVFTFFPVSLWLKVFMPIIGIKPLVLVLHWVVVISLSIVPVMGHKKLKQSNRE